MNQKVVTSEFIQNLCELLKKVPIPQQLNHSNISTKDKFDYVTSFDLELEKKISLFIKEKFHNHKIYSEENVSDQLSFNQPTWVIDPLDGTSNFIFQIPFFSTSIAFTQNGCVEFGLVYDFIHQECFYALKNSGSYLNDEKISSNHSSPSDFIGISSSFIDFTLKERPKTIQELRKIGKFRIIGSQALSLCYVACNRLKANFNYEAKVWDDLAACLILKESGNEYKSLNGLDPENLTTWQSKQILFSVAYHQCEEKKFSDLVNLII